MGVNEMKKTGIMITAVFFLVMTPALAHNFWSIYGEKITVNYTTRVGTGLVSETGRRLSNDEMFSVITKSFSQSMGIRLKEVARQRSGAAVPCIFTPTPEKCFVDIVMKATFDELQFMNAPRFSQDFLLKLRDFHTSSFVDRFSIAGKSERTEIVPPW